MGIGAGLLTGWMSAAVFAFAVAHADSGFLLIAYIAAIPLLMAGLGAGVISGALGALAGSIGLAIAVSLSVAFTFTVIDALPAALFCALALRYKTGSDGRVYWYPEGLLLTALALYPCVVFLIGVVLTLGHEGGLLGLTIATVQSGIDQLSSQMDANTAVQFKAVVPTMAKLMPALVGSCWSLLMLACAIFAQGTLQKEKWNIRGPIAWRDVSVPTWLVSVAAVAGLVGAFAPQAYPQISYIGTNVCIMLCMPLFFVGLAITHVYAATCKHPKWVLVAFYMLISILPWLVILVALLGTLDLAFGIRKRLTGTSEQV
jgi:hypothetical protein